VVTRGWEALAGRRVGVWGLGVEGRATLRRLAADGIEPVAIVDRETHELSDGREAIGLHLGGLDLLADCEVVIKSPGISPYDDDAAAVRDRGAHLVGGLGLWLEDAPRERVACVTGTKGKSTTTAIAGALCRGLDADAFVGGNLGGPPWDPEAPPADWYLIELSSYQAYDVTVGPRVVAVTSLSQDHLTWHHGYPNYVRDKLSICTRPGVDVVVAPASDDELRQHADLLGTRVTYVKDSEPPWVAELGVMGAHNVRNALVAQAILLQLGVPRADHADALRVAAAGYEPLPSRLTWVGAVGAVDFVDDSLSTNTLPTLAAVAAFEGRRVALIVGGQDRGIDYTPLALGLRARADSILVLTVPTSGERIAATLRRHAPELPVQECADLPEATAAGHSWASPDGAVLLSPAAPSFDYYRDYSERAEVFAAAMRGLR
jgi:UDP-N-acetylmuramoyl-L-alanine---L-glutamate ligase